MTNETTNQIAKLNDLMRQGMINGRFMMTQGVLSMGDDVITELMQLVANFNTFTPDNDPYGEHDFGSINHKGTKYFWKIDYHDTDYQYHSPDPASTEVTNRVLTLMQAGEY